MIWSTLAVVLLVLVTTGCIKAPNKTIKIGVIAAMSGDAAAYGEQERVVYDYQLAKVNEKYAKKGIRFELIYEDGKCTGIDAVSAYQKLTDVDGVKFILGGDCSSATLGIAPLTKDDKVLAITAMSSNPSLNKLSPYTYSFSFSDNVVADTLAEQMKGFSRVAIISEQNDYNIGVQKAWLESMKKYPNVAIVANEVFPKGASDVRSVLEKVKNTRPDAVLLNPNPGVTAETLLRQLGEVRNWSGYKLFGQYSYLSDDSRKVVPALTEGMIIADSPNLTSPEFLAVKAEIEKDGATVKDLGNYYTASTIEAVNVLTDLIAELGENPEAVRNALAERTFDGLIGLVHFGDNSFPESRGAVYVVKNGKAEAQP